MRYLNYHSIKWILFTVMMLTVPSLLFLVMVIMFMPAIFFMAGMVYVIPKLFAPGHATESLSFIIMLGGHGLLFAGIYYVIAILMAKTILRLKSPVARLSVLSIICISLGLLTILPVYGGGGHGPMRWQTLAGFFNELNMTYGGGAIPVIYGVSLLLLVVYLLLKNRKPKHEK
jgi:hypothetical protein